MFASNKTEARRARAFLHKKTMISNSKKAKPDVDEIKELAFSSNLTPEETVFRPAFNLNCEKL